MYRSVYDLRTFYTGKVGRVVRRILRERIQSFWPDVKGMRIAGNGYATPYLRTFMDDAERVIALMPAAQGAHPWPYNSSPEEKNLVQIKGPGQYIETLKQHFGTDIVPLH